MLRLIAALLTVAFVVLKLAGVVPFVAWPWLLALSPALILVAVFFVPFLVTLTVAVIGFVVALFADIIKFYRRKFSKKGG